MALGLTGHLGCGARPPGKPLPVPAWLAVRRSGAQGGSSRARLCMMRPACPVLRVHHAPPVDMLPLLPCSCLTATDLYRYLAQEHDATIIALLLGMAASKRWACGPGPTESRTAERMHCPAGILMQALCRGSSQLAAQHSSTLHQQGSRAARPWRPPCPAAGAARTRPSARRSSCTCPHATPPPTLSSTSRRSCRQAAGAGKLLRSWRASIHTAG